MINAAFDLGEKIHDREVKYKLYSPGWTLSDPIALDFDFHHWTTIKYLNDDCDNFGDDIEIIPSNSGGLYLFSINCPIIKGCTEFPVYIGRAKFTRNQNLKKRCKEYFLNYRKQNERPLLTRMFKYWSNELHLSFLPINNNDLTVLAEKNLINSLLLPFNTEIPDTLIRAAVKAFQ